MPSASSVLCLQHFEETAYTKNIGISAAVGLKRRLVADAIPTIDAAGLSQSASTSTAELSSRDRRQVNNTCCSLIHSCMFDLCRYLHEMRETLKISWE